MEGLLFEMTPADPLTIAGVAAILILVTLAAAATPGCPRDCASIRCRRCGMRDGRHAAQRGAIRLRRVNTPACAPMLPGHRT